MEIKDNYDYNKPKFSSITDKYLDNKKVIAEDWWLKPMDIASSVYVQELGSAGRYYGDFKSVCRDVRIIGTELQNYNLFCKMLKEHGWQLKDSWDADMKPEYLDLYKNNNKKPLIINLI